MNQEPIQRIIRGLAVVAIVAFAIHVFSDNKADVDLWGNLGFVTAPAWSPAFHTTNTFAFTEPDHAWINHEWLSEYLLRLTFDTAGSPGLLLLKTSLGLILLLILWRSIRQDCASQPARFLLLVLLISTIGFGFSTRPHLFTYVLYALFLFMLKRWPKGEFVTLTAIPLLGILWANLHGAFFSGALLLGVYLLLETSRTHHTNDTAPRHLTALGWSLALFLALTLLNPYGPRLWRFVMQSASLPRPYLSEWAPFNEPAFLLIHLDFVVLVLISAVALLLTRQPRSSTWFGILGLAFVSAIILRRNIPLFAITAAFVIPRHVDDIAARPLATLGATVRREWVALFLAVLTLVSVWGALRFNKSAPAAIEVPQDRFPTDVIAFMKDNRIQGNALTFFDWAEYSIWRLDPDCKQFLDGRFSDAYSVKTIKDYRAFLYAEPGWETALTDYPTDIVLIHRGNPAYPLMLTRDGWTLVCESDLAALFLKKDRHAEFLDRLSRGEFKRPVLTLPVLFPG